jgi:nicotinamide-nucleotide amidase
LIDNDTLQHAQALLVRLRARSLTVATAESCTGGLVTAALTHHAGSSASVLGGFVTYSNAMKHALLGVETELLESVGAVSEGVAAAMAAGALARSGADIAVSITGVAGPGGGSADKPVGLVWFGLAVRGQPTRTERALLAGDRQTVRESSVRKAFALLDAGTDAI